MSLGRYLGLAVVAIWLVVATVFAVADVSVLVDPVSRRAQHVCSKEVFQGHPGLITELSDQQCLPRLAMRGGFDALLVGLPLIFGFALVSRRGRRSRSRQRAPGSRVLSSSVSSVKTARFAGK